MVAYHVVVSCCLGREPGMGIYGIGIHDAVLDCFLCIFLVILVKFIW